MSGLKLNLKPGDKIEMPILLTVRAQMRVRTVDENGGVVLDYDTQEVPLSGGSMAYDAVQFAAQADLSTWTRS